MFTEVKDKVSRPRNHFYLLYTVYASGATINNKKSLQFKMISDSFHKPGRQRKCCQCSITGYH